MIFEHNSAPSWPMSSKLHHWGHAKKQCCYFCHMILSVTSAFRLSGVSKKTKGSSIKYVSNSKGGAKRVKMSLKSPKGYKYCLWKGRLKKSETKKWCLLWMAPKIKKGTVASFIILQKGLGSTTACRMGSNSIIRNLYSFTISCFAVLNSKQRMTSPVKKGLKLVVWNHCSIHRISEL